jgi:hypothetical protein
MAQAGSCNVKESITQDSSLPESRFSAASDAVLAFTPHAAISDSQVRLINTPYVLIFAPQSSIFLYGSDA